MRLSDLKIAGIAKRVGIGDAAIADPSEALRATLGSCVGLCIAQPSKCRFALAHILLPRPANGNDPGKAHPARFATTAVAHLLEVLEVKRRGVQELRAYVAGGAAMYAGDEQKSQVGDLNRRALMETLKASRVRVAKSDFGGTLGRQLVVAGPEGAVYSFSLGSNDDHQRWELPIQFKPRP